MTSFEVPSWFHPAVVFYGMVESLWFQPDFNFLMYGFNPRGFNLPIQGFNLVNTSFWGIDQSTTPCPSMPECKGFAKMK